MRCRINCKNTPRKYQRVTHYRPFWEVVSNIDTVGVWTNFCPAFCAVTLAVAKAIDVWSVGCIFAELLLRKPFFMGNNYVEQLTIICEKMGKPQPHDLTFIATEKVHVRSAWMARLEARQLPMFFRSIVNGHRLQGCAWCILNHHEL